MKTKIQKFYLLIIVLLLLVIVGAFFLGNKIHYYQPRLPASVIGSTVVSLVNQDRQAAGLQPLTVNPVLAKAADLKAEDMAKNGYFGHVSPTGTSTAYWFSAVKYKYLYAGENLAVNYDDSKTVEQAWMDSITHRDNILNDKFSEIGVAVATGTVNGQPALYVVQMFGRQSSPTKVSK